MSEAVRQQRDYLIRLVLLALAALLLAGCGEDRNRIVAPVVCEDDDDGNGHGARRDTLIVPPWVKGPKQKENQR